LPLNLKVLSFEATLSNLKENILSRFKSLAFWNLEAVEREKNLR
jgi:hypothetical protein